MGPTLVAYDSFQDEIYLKEQTSKGSEEAFKLLFDQYHDKLFQYVYHTVKSSEIAEELVMDVFLKLWLGRDTLPEIENLNGFLFKVAYNKTIDFFRSVARNKRLADLLAERTIKVAPATIYDRLTEKEYEQSIRKAISLMPPRRKLIYELSRDESLSHEEISQKLEISNSTVANTIADARKFIRDHFKTIDLITVAAITFILK